MKKMNKNLLFVMFVLFSLVITFSTIIYADDVDIILTEDAVAGGTGAEAVLTDKAVAFGSADNKVVGNTPWFRYNNVTKTVYMYNASIMKSLAIGSSAVNVNNSPIYGFHEFYSSADNRLLTATMNQKANIVSPHYPATLRFEANYYGNASRGYRLSGGNGVVKLWGSMDGVRTWVNSIEVRAIINVTSAISTRSTFVMVGVGKGNVSTVANYWASNTIRNGTVVNLVNYGVENTAVSLQGNVRNQYVFYCSPITGVGNPWCIYQLGASPSRLNGNLTVTKNISTNQYFFGSGKFLTDLPMYNSTYEGGDGSYNSSYVDKIGDTMTGPLDIIHTAIEPDDHTLELDTNASGFGDVKALDISYVTGTISMGDDEGIILINIDETLATGGDVFGLEVLATSGNAEIYGMKTGALVGPIHQDSGVFANPTTATNNTASTDISEMADGNFTSLTNIFKEDNFYIIIGAAIAFEEAEFILSTTASVSIKPTFWYSTSGTGQFTQFTPVDGTNGFKNTGLVSWDASDLTGHVADDVTGTYDIKIIRTKNTLTTTPILGYAKVAATTEYIWDKYGNLLVHNISAQNISANYFFGNGSKLKSLPSVGDGSYNSTYEAFNSTTNIQNLLNDIGLNLSYLNVGKVNLSLGFTSIVKPFTDALYDLGTSTLRWLTGYFVNILVSGDANVTGNLSIIEGDLRGGVTYSVLYMDVVVASQNGIVDVRTWQDEIISSAAQPDVPRTLQLTATNGDDKEEMVGTVIVSGTDTDGVAIAETFTILVPTESGITYRGVRAFALVDTNGIAVSVTNAQAGQTYQIGVDDLLGLPNYPFQAETDVFKIKKNAVDFPIPTVNMTYGTVDCSGDIAGGEDYTFWYRPFK